jgi:transcription antitermination factor NusG
MINYSNEEDILFTIDSEHIFLSELNNLSSQEQCSWFGNALHKVLNADMQTLSYIEPSIKILVFVKANILERLYNIVKNVSYISNYKSNSKKHNHRVMYMDKVHLVIGSLDIVIWRMQDVR